MIHFRGDESMAADVRSGATLVCSMGTGAGKLIAQPRIPVPFNPKIDKVDPKPIALATDTTAMVNIVPMGMCRSMSNPMVAAATGSNRGTLTMQPCIPMPVGTWQGFTPPKFENGKMTNNGKGTVNMGCQLTCSWAGVIRPTSMGG